MTLAGKLGRSRRIFSRFAPRRSGVAMSAPEDGEQDQDRQWNAKQPQQQAFAKGHGSLLSAKSERQRRKRAEVPVSGFAARRQDQPDCAGTSAVPGYLNGRNSRSS
jgi:hypothetical protein